MFSPKGEIKCTKVISENISIMKMLSGKCNKCFGLFSCNSFLGLKYINHLLMLYSYGLCLISVCTYS